MEKGVRRRGFESLDYDVLNLHNEQNLIIERIKIIYRFKKNPTKQLTYKLPLPNIVSGNH